MTDLETIAALRSALDHIAKSARASCTDTRRLRWIERRATMALAGEPYSDEAFDLPKYSPASIERMQRDARRYRKLRSRNLLAPLVDFTIGELSGLFGEQIDAVVDALPPLPDTPPSALQEQAA